jgi:cytochrome b561
LNQIIQLIGKFSHHGVQAPTHRWQTKWVHWLAAALLLFAVVTNGDVTGALFSPGAMRFETGVGLVMAVFYGGLWLWVRGPGGGTRLPARAPTWEKRLAGLVHTGIYLSIAAILLTGFAMAYFAPTDLVVNAPAERIVSMSGRFAFARDAHEFAAGLLGWLFGAHVAGALWHLVVRQDGVTQAIAPDRLARYGNRLLIRAGLGRL